MILVPEPLYFFCSVNGDDSIVKTIVFLLFFLSPESRKSEAPGLKQNRVDGKHKPITSPLRRMLAKLLSARTALYEKVAYKNSEVDLVCPGLRCTGPSILKQTALGLTSPAEKRSNLF